MARTHRNIISENVKYGLDGCWSDYADLVQMFESLIDRLEATQGLAPVQTQQLEAYVSKYILPQLQRLGTRKV